MRCILEHVTCKMSTQYSGQIYIIRLYNKKVTDESCESSTNVKQLVWQRMMVEKESEMNSGECFELSVIRDSVSIS